MNQIVFVRPIIKNLCVGRCAEVLEQEVSRLKERLLTDLRIDSKRQQMQIFKEYQSLDTFFNTWLRAYMATKTRFIYVPCLATTYSSVSKVLISSFQFLDLLCCRKRKNESHAYLRLSNECASICASEALVNISSRLDYLVAHHGINQRLVTCSL